MKLEFIGMDHWDNPVYKDENGNLWKDLDYGADEPDLHTTDTFDGDPSKPISTFKKYKDVQLEFSPKRVVRNPRSFDYQMLGRLQADCEYYLGFGCRSPERLWAGNEKDQIEKMKFIWNSFPNDGKPEWLTLEQIAKYESEMVN